MTQSATGLIGASGLTLNGGRFNLTENNAIATVTASAEELAIRDDTGLGVNGLNVSGTTRLISNGGTVTQSGAIVSAGLALSGAGGNFVLNDAGNNVGTLAGDADRIDYSQAGSLTIGAVTGADSSVTDGITVTDRVIVQVTDLLANLTLNSPVVAQGTGFAAVLSAQRDFVNNVGATGLQTPNGVWALYANNPITSSFNGLTAPTTVFENSITTLPPASLPAGANAIVFQTRAALVPPTGRDPPLEDFSQVGLQLLTLDAAESLYSDLLSDVRGYDFLDRLKRYGYVPLEVMYGGMKVPEGLTIQDVDLQKLRRRLGISGDPGHRYIWWR